MVFYRDFFIKVYHFLGVDDNILHLYGKPIVS